MSPHDMMPYRAEFEAAAARLGRSIVPFITISQPIMQEGCRSSHQCPKCPAKMVCDSSGKAGTREVDVWYILGPCCCIPPTCPACGHSAFTISTPPP